MATVCAHYRDLTNAQWDILNTLIPEPAPHRDGRGRPWKDRRAVLNGILWVLRTGAPWADVPNRYPSHQTRHRRFQQWVRSGVMKGVLEALASDLKTRGTLDVREAFIDGSLLRQKRGLQGWKGKARQGHENHGGCRPPRSAGSRTHRERDSTW
jgi:transposase